MARCESLFYACSIRPVLGLPHKNRVNDFTFPIEICWRYPVDNFALVHPVENQDSSENMGLVEIKLALIYWVSFSEPSNDSY